MNIIHLILVLATFIPTICGSYRLNNNNFENEWDDLIFQARAAAQLNSDCNWITYEQDGSGKIYSDPKSYSCPDKTVVGGYCILPWSQAVTVCTSDPKCGGLSLTTNMGWHNAYDKNNEASVHLLGVSSPLTTNNNVGWYMLFKKCWKFSP